jgi:hypothetical protein
MSSPPLGSRLPSVMKDLATDAVQTCNGAITTFRI